VVDTSLSVDTFVLPVRIFSSRLEAARRLDLEGARRAARSWKTLGIVSQFDVQAALITLKPARSLVFERS
jgi:hypothetical protein